MQPTFSGMPVENKLSTDKTAALSRIWQRVLRREHIGVDEDFFDLGGDPWRAVELFLDIEKMFGRSLPPLLMYQAPTIASLAALLEAPSPPAVAKCVRLKAGSLESPVFLTHGMGGNILEFFDFVHHLQTPHTLYGLQARGTDGLDKPCSSIDEMAYFHLEAIKALQPQGPYILVGYSLGGLVALEMARHLAETGESIALLVMIDSYPSLRYAPLAQRLGVISRAARHYASGILRLPGSKVIPHAHRRTAEQSDTLQGPNKFVSVRRSVGIAFTPAMRCVQEAAVLALRDYQPRFYSGRIRFVRAAKPLHFPDDPEKVWAKFTDQFELETVPGDHHELLTTQYESLARVISSYLRELSVERLTGSLDQ
jgi:thioesterase domain-containing protein/acyl carrier protein